MPPKHTIYFIMLLAAFFQYRAYGQSTLKFKHLGSSEGLSHNSVLCILQGHNDVIWLGTDDGLNKYDGYDFTIYKHKASDKNSLSHSQINALLEDRQHNIWIGTSSGVNIFNPASEKFIRVKLPGLKNGKSNKFVSSLLQDKDGNIWIGTYSGLYQYNLLQKKVFSYPDIINTNPESSEKIRALFLDMDSKIWVSTVNDLRTFSIVHRQYIDLPGSLNSDTLLKKSDIRVIKKDASGSYWFGTETAGVLVYDHNYIKSASYNANTGASKALISNVVRDILFINNSVWVGTRDGLNLIDLKKNVINAYVSKRFDPESLSHNSVRCFLADKTGTIWIGTFAGGIDLYSANANNFGLITQQVDELRGLNSSVVSSILPDTAGNLWIGTEGGGLNYFDRKSGNFKYYNVQKDKSAAHSNIVKSIALAAANKLWIGTYDGLLYFDISTGGYISYEIKGVHEKKDKSYELNALLTDKAGVWAGINGSGLYYINKDKHQVAYRTDPKKTSTLSSDFITALAKDHIGNLWVGTQRGLNYFDKKTNSFTRYFNSADKLTSLNNNTIVSLFIDNQGRLWVGTIGGLNYYDRKKHQFFALTEDNGLANNVINAIQQDKLGNIWISTNKGLTRIGFKKFTVPFSSKNLDISNFTPYDGLQSDQFSPRASAKCQNGEMIFGGINGLNNFFPERVVGNKFKPNIILTSLEIKGKEVKIAEDDSPLSRSIDETKSITLNYDQAFLTLKFAALNYWNPGKNKYAYKMEGLRNDNEWHYVGSQRTATYTNLDAGTYVFKVKAANNDNVWNNAPRSLKIIILPPLYKTWWAFLIYSVIFGFLLYLFYRYSYKTAQLKNELDTEHKLRQKDEELAQGKLSFFTNISHEIKTPLTLILAPLESLIDMNQGNNRIQNQLMLMQRNGERLIRLVTQLLDFRKFESGNMKLTASKGNIVKLAQEVLMAFNPYAKQRDIDLIFFAEQDEMEMWFDEDKMEKILYNLLSNAIKFTASSSGGEVKLSLTFRTLHGQDFICIAVQDNGIGIASNDIGRLFEQYNINQDSSINATGTGIGLVFTKALVELHHGAITVSSKPATAEGHGHTCFNVLFKTGLAHFAVDEIKSKNNGAEDLSLYDYDILADSDFNITAPQETEYSNVEKAIMLIVEDNQELSHFIQQNFAEDFIVHIAENGVQGYHKAIELIPDIIISDVMMPEMDGTVLCSKLKSDNRTSHIPIILLTARTPLIYKIEGFENGADDYLVKPFSIKVLKVRIKNLLLSREKLRQRYSKEVNLQPANIAITSADEKFFEKVMAFIEKHIEDPAMSVEQMGQDVGMSRATLYRKIKALTNLTTTDFVRSIRLKRAAQLLEQKKFNVNEVAYMVGFIDVDYFRKCFKEQFGVTPKEYINTGGV
jgi:ligand-binding sensor domain-containing protein/signal transduction histidine kinase/DNA-binding response OmpR family regulator